MDDRDGKREETKTYVDIPFLQLVVIVSKDFKETGHPKIVIIISLVPFDSIDIRLSRAIKANASGELIRYLRQKPTDERIVET